MNVFFVTNRAPDQQQPGAFLDSAPIQPAVSRGVCTVSIPPTHQRGEVERPAIWRFEKVEDVRSHIVITARQLSPDAAEFRAKLHGAFQQAGSQAFLFVHGYNVTFDDAVRRTAQLFRDLQFDGVPILFSWPGQNAWWRYPAAEDSVNGSARALEAFLAEMFASEKLDAINVIAHSMGNRVFSTALERLRLRNIDAQFSNIVMAAPDINIADFDAISSVLRSSAKRTTVYASEHDVALQVSRAFHTYPRLGEAPPRVLRPDVDTVDASAISRDLLGHSYFGDSMAVLDDLVLLLRKQMVPADRALQRRQTPNGDYWVVPKR